MPLIIAHRGASHDAPENTLAAFRLAFEQGADGIEGDFRLTADGHVVCCHDLKTARCGDREMVVAESTLDELRAVDVGAWKSPAYTGERVPTLAEVLAVLPPGGRAFLELKGPQPGLADAAADVVRRSGVAVDRLRLMAFDLATVLQVRRLLPEVATSWLVALSDRAAHGLPSPLPAVLAGVREHDIEGVGVEADATAVTAEFAASLRGDGRSLHVWTVDTADGAAAFVRLGAASITTNRPGWLRDALSGDIDRILADNARPGR